MISIHAPRTGSDGGRIPTLYAQSNFNPRSPHGERLSRDGHTMSELFQSTLPARGATPVLSGRVPVLIYFNPRSPHGERHHLSIKLSDTAKISIHAPRTGSDTAQHPDSPRGGHFNPRSPHGERRPRQAGSSVAAHFNPRSPHGERPYSLFHWFCCVSFQSTLPARGATFPRVL